MRVPSLTAALVACLLLLSWPVVAGAAEDGVTIDPGSPSAKEYALPLESARREAAGAQGKPTRPGARQSPLFGEGVSRDGGSDETKTTAAAGAEANGGSGSGGASSSGGGAANSSRVDSGKGERASSGGATSATERESAAASLASDAGGTGSSTAFIGGGLGVLLLVLLGGAALRAVRGPDTA